MSKKKLLEKQTDEVSPPCPAMLTYISECTDPSTAQCIWPDCFVQYLLCEATEHNDTRYMDIGYITNTWVSHDQGPLTRVISPGNTTTSLYRWSRVIRALYKNTTLESDLLLFRFLRIPWIENISWLNFRPRQLRVERRRHDIGISGMTWYKVSQHWEEIPKMLSFFLIECSLNLA